MPLRIGQEVQALLRRHLSPVNAAFRRRLLSFELVLHRIVPFLETASVIQGHLERTGLHPAQQLTIGFL